MVTKEMQQMVDEARSKGMWLHCIYQDLWFSPSELEKEWEQGHFCWGAVNWQVRSPAKRLHRLEVCVQHATKDIENFKRRMNNDTK